jgi:site-specific recombinase XerD
VVPLDKKAVTEMWLLFLLGKMMCFQKVYMVYVNQDVNQMKATIDVICYKWKKLKNGEYPLMMRVTKDGKRKYVSLGVSAYPDFWDFEKNKPKRNCPNKDLINQLILEKTKTYREQALEYNVENKDFTSKSLIDRVSNPSKIKTVQDMLDIHIERLTSSNRERYAETFQLLKNSMIMFNGHLDIYFSDVDVSWLRDYESWLRKRGLKENTIGIRFRTLRVLYNVAIEEKAVKKDYYPFDTFKVSRLHQETAKRAITKQQIANIINYQSLIKNDIYTSLSVDLFAFSYLMAGVNFVDIAYLNQDNIVDNRLVYTRKKTKKLIMIPLQSKAMDLIQKYSDTGSPYLFPILNKFHKTAQQKANRIHKVISKVNKRLKEIGKELNLPIDITTYVARHSFATVLKRSGVSTSIISETLGHSSEKVTQIYLDSFENSQIDEALENLL